MNRLLLLDGNALLHRAYHALPPLTTPLGKPAGAVYGFLSMLFRLRTDLHPSHYAVTFDRAAPTFRNEMLATYQSQRPPMEEDLVSQVQTIHDALEACHVPMFEVDGFEADDVIGTLVKRVCDEHMMKKIHDKHMIDQIIIVTGDRDILQLVEDERVLVYMPIKGLTEAKLYGEKEVFERLGVYPTAIPDWKAFAGDSSDNYSGVPGIGPKTATELVLKYKTVEDVYAHLDAGTLEVTDRIKEKLRLGKDMAYLSKNLATIRTNAPITIDVAALALESFDQEDSQRFLEHLGFQSLLRRMRGETVEKKKKDPTTPRPRGANEKKKVDSDQMDLFS